MTSARFEELEKRCAKLKKTRIIRIVFIIASLFLVGFGSYYWMSHSTSKSLVPLVQTPVVENNESNESISNEEQNLSQSTDDEILFLAPHIYKNYL